MAIWLNIQFPISLFYLPDSMNRSKGIQEASSCFFVTVVISDECRFGRAGGPRKLLLFLLAE